MPLLIAPRGETMQVLKVTGDEAVARRLGDLGIVSGADIILLSESGGSMIVRVNDSRLAIDRAVARSIVVRQKVA